MANRFDLAKYKACARRAAAEGAVLLRNEDGVLPLAGGCKVAVFGRSQFNYYKSGTGSGGMVNVDHVIGIPEALDNSGLVVNKNVSAVYEEWLKDHPFDVGQGWAAEPWYQEEMPLSDELVREAADESDTALVVIGRTAGEDRDNLVEEGSYLLTKTEEEMLQKVCGAFSRTVVLLNVGNIMDMKWVEVYKPQAVLYVWQGGQEGGAAVVDVLSGAVPVGGKLTDTIAKDISDYPSTKNYGGGAENVYEEDIYVGYRYFETFAKDKVLYPFGFGLSYTTFAVSVEGVHAEAIERNKTIEVKVRVRNTGARPGAEVVQVYVEKPQGRLGQPARALVGYARTKELLPGEEEQLTVCFSWYGLGSYDDSGCTGHKSAYVLEAGEYGFYVGTDVRSAQKTAVFTLPETVVLEELEEALAPTKNAKRIKPSSWLETEEPMSTRTISPLEKRLERLPEEIPYTGDRGYSLKDVRDGKVRMEDFIAQLSNEELAEIVRGEGMNSPKVTAGAGGAFGGVTEPLKYYGIPVACCTDGPSGIRLDCGSIAVSMPNGTCLACSFDEALVEELYEWEGMELRRNRVDALLGPGMNIHRNPLNGRNFEYFSEDPLVSGKMAAAQLRGMNRYGVTGVIKHFAGNNQEFRRNYTDDIVSERALREIYLKGFEIAVKEGKAFCVMSTYGLINGTHTASDYDLLTAVLRGEWGFDGVVMTDWWAWGNEEGGPGNAKNTAQMLRAQNDLVMVVSDSASNSGEDNTLEGLASGILTRAELARSAMNICRVILRLPVMDRFLGKKSELDEELEASWSQLDQAVAGIEELDLASEGEVSLSPEKIKTAAGDTTLFQVMTPVRGVYRMKMQVRAVAESPLAQIPMTVFYDREVLQIVTLTGADKEWRPVEIELRPSFVGAFYLKFYFGQAGMEIQDITFSLIESKEEELTRLREQFLAGE